ncbi:MAG: 23S rRNA (pseudouridine(1915)-N(3))-methyltransferase RlmH [Pseudomonadota bacterium]
MRISIIAAGNKMPGWVSEAVADYQRRLPKEFNLKWHEVPLAHRARESVAKQLREREGEQLLKAIPSGDRVVALDVKGKRICTEHFAKRLNDWRMSGDNYSFLIGGPDGLGERCLSRAETRWSLSDLTLPHPLVRVLLIEQLYRAWTITINHPYHRS